MSTLLQRASLLAAALALVTVRAHAGPNNAFLDTVREFADPAYSQSDAGLLIVPDAGPVVAPAPAQPEIVYVPYAEPVYVGEPVTNYVYAAPRRNWVRTHFHQTGNAAAPKPESPHHPETPNNKRG